jgi:hypothetical protein
MRGGNKIGDHNLTYPHESRHAAAGLWWHIVTPLWGGVHQPYDPSHQ